MKLRSLAAILTITITQLAAQTGAEFYQRAVTAERAGKMTEAIQLYEKVAKDFASDRPLAAKALVQAARGYERLGQDGALKLYERIARDFADQTDYAQTARAKAAALREPPPPPTISTRKVEMSDSIKNIMATDGVHVLTVDEPTLAVWYSDITGNNRRMVTQLKPGQVRPTNFWVSKDLSVILFYYADRDHLWAMVKTDGTGYREFPEMQSKGLSGDRTAPRQATLSWDNRFAVISQGPRLWKLNMVDGQATEIRAERPRAITAMAISPDGRYLAAIDGVSRFIVPLQGGEVREINVGPVISWTRDGRFLVTSTPSGSTFELALQPMQDGRPSGEPLLVHASLPGLVARPTVTASGAVLMTAPNVAVQNLTTASVASLDDQDRLGSWKALQLVNSPLHHSLSWSPDGKKIAYVSKESPSDTKQVIRIYDIATRQDRELYRATTSDNTTCAWAVRRAALYCASENGRTTDMLLVSTETGVAEKMATFPGQWLARSTSPDDRFVSVTRFGFGQASATGLWEVGTPEPAIRQGARSTVSGEWLIRRNNVANPPSIEARRTAGDDAEWRTITPAAPLAEAPYNTPDEKWMVWVQREANERKGLWRAPITGGESQRLGDYPLAPIEGSLRISRDGRQFVVPTMNPAVTGADYWLLENFVPRPAAPSAKPLTRK